jgi:hypothetical protein
MDFDLDKLGEIADPFDLEVPPRPAPVLAAIPRTSHWRSAVVLAAVALLLAAWVSRTGVASRPALTPVVAFCAFGLPVCASVLAFAGFRHRGRLGIGLQMSQLVTIAVIATLGFIVSVVMTPSSGGDVFTLKSMLGCAVMSTALAALPLVGGFVAFRRTLVGNAAVRMLLFGLGCALIGALLIRVHCTQESVAHLLLGHGVALPAFGLLGALVGRRQMSL